MMNERVLLYYKNHLQYIELRARLLELRYNHNHDERGRFASGGGGGSPLSSGNSAKGVDKFDKSGIMESEINGYPEENFDRKSHLNSQDEDLLQCNPNYVAVRNGAYENNCQRCVPTYALRRRGFNVEALPVGENPEIDKILSQNPHFVWGNNGISPKIHSTINSKYFGKPEIENFMKNSPDGTIVQIRCIWNTGNMGHTFVAEKINGKTHYMDPQTGNNNVAHYFKSMKKNQTTFWRIDNAAPNDDYIKYCCKNKGE